jgi:hypothetical protein
MGCKEEIKKLIVTLKIQNYNYQKPNKIQIKKSKNTKCFIRVLEYLEIDICLLFGI